MHPILLFAAALVIFISSAQGKSIPPRQSKFPDETEAERWVRTELTAGKIADLSVKCGKTISIRHSIGLGWGDKCRALRGDFVAHLLTHTETKTAAAPHGIVVKGARVSGIVDLSFQHVKAFAKFMQSRFDSGINLDGASLDKTIHFDEDIIKDGVSFRNAIFANSLILSRSLVANIDGTYANVAAGISITGDREVKTHVDSMTLDGTTVRQDVDLSGSVFDQDVSAQSLHAARLMMQDGSIVGGKINVRAADISGDLDLAGSIVKGGIDGDRLHVGGALFLSSSNTVIKGPLSLPLAAIDGSLNLDAGQFLGGVDLSEASVKRSLTANKAVFAGDGIDLSSSVIGGNLQFDDVRFNVPAHFDSMHVSGNAYIGGKSSVARPFSMSGAKIDGFFLIRDTIFESEFDAHLLIVGSSLFIVGNTEFSSDLSLHGARINGRMEISLSHIRGSLDASESRVGEEVILSSVFDRPVDFSNAHVADDVDLTGSNLNNLNLSGATIGGGLLLVNSTSMPQWVAPSQLFLRNTRIGFIQDGGGAGLDPWALNLDLDGLTYDRFDSLRDADGAESWLERDGAFTLQPYAQLVSVVKNSGDPDRANDVLYLQRNREISHKWNLGVCGYGWGLVSLSSLCWQSAGLFILKWVIGFGLGNRIFFVLVWVAIFTALGWIVLLSRDKSRVNGPLWCAGASLSRLLPIIELNKEFGDFFSDPKRRRLHGWQIAYFSFHAIMGYVLGSFVIAALAGLTQTR